MHLRTALRSDGSFLVMRLATWGLYLKKVQELCQGPPRNTCTRTTDCKSLILKIFGNPESCLIGERFTVR